METIEKYALTELGKGDVFFSTWPTNKLTALASDLCVKIKTEQSIIIPQRYAAEIPTQVVKVTIVEPMDADAREAAIEERKLKRLEKKLKNNQ